jgi:hypothetical protein
VPYTVGGYYRQTYSAESLFSTIFGDESNNTEVADMIEIVSQLMRVTWNPMKFFDNKQMLRNL